MGLMWRQRPTTETIDLERYEAAMVAASAIRARIEAGQVPALDVEPPTIALVPGEQQALLPVVADVARCDLGEDEKLPDGSLWPLSPGEAILARNAGEPTLPRHEWEQWQRRWRPLGPAIVTATTHRLTWVGAPRRRQTNLWWPQITRVWTAPTLRQVVAREAGRTLWRLQGDELPPLVTVTAHIARREAHDSP